MVSLARNALNLTVGLQGVALMGRAAGMAKESLKQSKKKKFKSKDIIKGSVDILIGTALITPTAKLVQSID